MDERERARAVAQQLVPIYRWREPLFDCLLFSSCALDLDNRRTLVFPRDRAFSVRICHVREISRESGGAAHHVTVSVGGWGLARDSAAQFGVLDLPWMGLPPDKKPEFLAFRRALYNIATAAYPSRELPVDEYDACLQVDSFSFLQKFDAQISNQLIAPSSLSGSPTPAFPSNAVPASTAAVMLQRKDSLKRRHSLNSDKRASAEQVVSKPTRLVSDGLLQPDNISSLHDEAEESQDAVLLQDVLHDLEAICRLIAEKNTDSSCMNEDDVNFMPLASSARSLQLVAARTLGRLMDLLQSLWTLTNPDVCESLDELDDRITSVFALFESEILHIHSEMKSFLLGKSKVARSEAVQSSCSLEKLAFPTYMLPFSSTSDHLLHRICDIFGFSASQSTHVIQKNTEIRVGSLVRIVRDDGEARIPLRCRATASCDPDAFTSPQVLISSSMDLSILRVNAPDEFGFAFVSVPNGQTGFVECKDFVHSSHFDAPTNALPSCNSVVVSLMRCVQRVAMRVRLEKVKFDFDLVSLLVMCWPQELVLGFVDYTSNQAENWDNNRIDVVRAYRKFLSSSALDAAEGFLKKNLFSNTSVENSEVANMLVSKMIEYIGSIELIAKIDLLPSIAYPVELGIRLRELIYPLLKLYDDHFEIGPDERSYIEEFALTFAVLSRLVKSPDGFMFWYLKSRIFMEAVYHFDVICQADRFIDNHLHQIFGHDRTLFTICDEETPKTFCSLKRLLLDYLQPSALQLLAALHDCLRRLFDSHQNVIDDESLSHCDSNVVIEPTILRASQSSDVDPDDSPRLARRVFLPASVPKTDDGYLAQSIQEEKPFDFASTSKQGVQTEISTSLDPRIQMPKSSELRIFSVLEYRVTVEKHRWTFSLRPSITPYRLLTQSNVDLRVARVVKVDGCQEFIFSPLVAPPVSCADSMLTYSGFPMRLEDSKGSLLDYHFFDGFKLDTSLPFSSNSTKAFRMQGYSIRVRQFFLQIDAKTLGAADVMWVYLSDDGSYLKPYSLEHTLLIETEFSKARSGGGSYRFDLEGQPGVNWEIDFSNMSQRNIISGSVRVILRIDDTHMLFKTIEDPS